MRWCSIIFAAQGGHFQQVVHSVAVEPLSVFGAGLNFDEFSAGGVGDVHVHLGAGIVVVIEIEEDFAVDEADADGG